MRDLQFIKDKHTYVNRINNILKFYDRIQSPRYRWSFGKPDVPVRNSQSLRINTVMILSFLRVTSRMNGMITSCLSFQTPQP